MVICKVAMDLANNNSAVATASYEVLEDGTRRRKPGTSRLWNDLGARQRNSCLIPSVILYKEKNSELSRDCYGYDALAMIKQCSTPFKLSNHIKYRFFVENDPYGDNAVDFTNLAKYMLDIIDFEGAQEPDAYEISVSYPVICDDENLYQLENIIYDALAGHSKRIERITFINEAECAFRFAVSDKTVQTAIYNTLTVKDEAIMLVCDIGGSTMELSLYGFTRDGKKVQYSRKGILRGDDKEGRGLGSYAMDKALRNKLYGSGLLDQNRLQEIPETLLMLRWITPLKESLNNRLRIGKNGSLDSLNDIAVPEKLREHNTVDQQQFEQWCRGYTAAVCRQIKNLAEQAGLKPEDIDLAILTGGGCKLYPVKTAIQELLKPGNRDTACVLCPDDPSSILDGKIIQEDNPDFCNGLCPKTELASLACVLGNLAEKVDLTMPVDDVKRKLKEDVKPKPKEDVKSNPKEDIEPKFKEDVKSNPKEDIKPKFKEDAKTKVPPVLDLAGTTPKPNVPLIAQGEIEGFGRWTLDENGLLDIIGSGKMPDWERGVFNRDTDRYDTTTPWNAIREKISKARIAPGITSIGKYAFERCENLTSINIPNGVTNIVELAFYECESLTSITIPSSVTSIGAYAFSSCKSLTSVNIPNSVTSIGDGAFYECKSLTSITVPDSVTYIGKNAFSWCSSLTSITIPNSVTSIGREAFGGCYQLIDIGLPKELTEIGEYAFAQCYSLTQITLPKKLVSIGNAAFKWCFSLEKINIPPSVVRIGEEAFLGCPFSQDTVEIVHQGEIENFGRWELDALGRLYITGTGKMPSFNTCPWDDFDTCPWDEYKYEVQLVDIRGNVTEIHSMPRGVCLVSLPESLSSIRRYAFSGCEYLLRINIPNGVTHIGESAFSGCKSLTSITIPGSVVEIGKNAFAHCERLTSVIIPDGVRYLGGGCFYGCNSLTYIKLPFSLVSRSSGAFLGCPNVEIIWPEEEDDQYSVVASGELSFYIPDSFMSLSGPRYNSIYWKLYRNGAMHLSSYTDVRMYDYSKLESREWHSVKDQIKEVVIDSVIHRIGKFAFAQCPNLERVFIPYSTTEIGSYAFWNCSKLSQVVWVSSDDALRNSMDGSIGSGAFVNCYSLTSIEIPSSIKFLSDAFSGCTALKKAYLPKHLKLWLFSTKISYGLPKEIVEYY